jgi:serine/threonine protein kinase
VTLLTSADFAGPENITRFSYRELARATSNFDQGNKIGEGGYGPVYKVIEQLVYLVLQRELRYWCLKCSNLPFQGTLKDGTAIAVKVLSLHSRQGANEFLNEILAISDVTHENLVKLYGCCVEGSHRILVYNFLENNSLAHTLLGSLSLWNPLLFFFPSAKWLQAITFLLLRYFRFWA